MYYDLVRLTVANILQIITVIRAINNIQHKQNNKISYLSSNYNSFELIKKQS